MMEWVHDPMLDSYEAITPVGKYLCVRTWLNTSKLYRDSELLGVWTSGSHKEAKEFAFLDYSARVLTHAPNAPMLPVNINLEPTP